MLLHSRVFGGVICRLDKLSVYWIHVGQDSECKTHLEQPPFVSRYNASCIEQQHLAQFGCLYFLVELVFP